MGGYGALLIAERATAQFRAVAAASPALWPRAAASAPGAFDDADDFRANDVHAGVAAVAALTVRIDCGTSDGFVAEARRFASALPPPNPGGFTAGYHDPPYWRSIATAQLRTIAAALSSG